jgi:hypothetical protein
MLRVAYREPSGFSVMWVLELSRKVMEDFRRVERARLRLVDGRVGRPACQRTQSNLARAIGNWRRKSSPACSGESLRSTMTEGSPFSLRRRKWPSVLRSRTRPLSRSPPNELCRPLTSEEPAPQPAGFFYVASMSRGVTVRLCQPLKMLDKFLQHTRHRNGRPEAA